MSTLSCAFNVDEPLVKTCKYCAMPMGNTILQETDPENPMCPVCQNRKLTDAMLKTSVNLVIYSFLFLIPMVLFKVVSFNIAMWIFLGFASTTLIAQKLMYPLMFRGLRNEQRIVPALHYFRINKDLGFYTSALKYASKVDQGFMEKHHDKYLPYIVMYVLLSETDIPTDWEKNWAKALRFTKDEFIQKLMDHVNELVNDVPIVFSMGFIPEILKFAKEYERKDVINTVIMNIKDNMKKMDKLNIKEKQRKTFYEDIYLAEDLLKEISEENDELKDVITFILEEMNRNYTPPEVPKSFADMLKLASEQQQMKINQEAQNNKDEEA